jgi:hypothetical protein
MVAVMLVFGFYGSYGAIALYNIEFAVSLMIIEPSTGSCCMEYLY